MKYLSRLLISFFLTIYPCWAQAQQQVIYTGSVPLTPTIPTDCTNGINYDIGGTFTCAPAPIPAGVVVLTVTSCPIGFTEATALDGVTLVGTLAAHGDVGTTGGANTITPTVATLTAAAQTFSGSSATSSSVSGGTPAGTNGTAAFTPAGTNGTAAFTPAGTNGTVTGPAQVISWPIGVPTISGTTINSFSSVINHTHTITVTSLVQGGTTAAVTGTHIMTSTATGGSARAPTSGDSFTATSANPGGGVASITPTINAAGTIAWPAGVPTNATSTIPAETFSGTPGTVPAQVFSGTPGTVPAQVFSGTPGTVPAEVFAGNALAGHTHATTATGTNSTSAVTGTLNNFDNRSAFVKVIFCAKD